MRLVNLAIVLVTLLVVVGGYFQERKRLATIRALPPDKARALYEAAQRRREPVMIAVTIALVLGAVAALVTRPGP